MIVLDCNAAVEIVRATAAGQALQELMITQESVISPTLFHAEAASAFKKFVISGALDQAEALECVRQAVGLVDRFIDLADLRTEAFTEALRLGHSAYDMFYFVLARRNAAILYTLDKRLIRICEEQNIDCVHILEDC